MAVCGGCWKRPASDDFKQVIPLHHPINQARFPLTPYSMVPTVPVHHALWSRAAGICREQNTHICDTYKYLGTQYLGMVYYLRL